MVEATLYRRVGKRALDLLLVIPALYKWFADVPEREAEALAAD